MDEPPSYTFLLILQESGFLYIFLAAILVFLTSLASASEAAFFSLTADDLSRLRNSNRGNEKFVAEILSNPRLLLTTLTALKYTMIAGAAVTFIFFLVGTAYSTYSTGSLFAGSFTLTIAFAFFGVILPKIYGKENNVNVARKAARICKGLIYFYRPLITPLFKMSNQVETRLEKLTEQRSAAELSEAFKAASANQETSEREREILQGIVNFGTLTIKQVMRLRSEIAYLDASINFHAVLELVRKSGYSRIPVGRYNLDSIEGVLYVKDLLPFLHEGPSFPWQRLIRQAYFALETRKIDQLLKDFQEKRVHVALVVDEYGTLTGLITLEDIIEEIIGDINDEFDDIAAHYQKIDSRTFIFDGKTSMHDFCKIFPSESVIFSKARSANTSLSGMLKQLRGALPKPGEPLVVKPFTFIVEKMDNRRIKKVRVQLNDKH